MKSIHEHREFQLESRERWKQLTGSLDKDDPGRLLSGHYEVAFSLLESRGDFSLEELKVKMSATSEASSGVWFLFNDPYLRAHTSDNSIETMVRNSGERWSDREACYYWRVRKDLRFYLARAYQENHGSELPPWFHYALPIWRIGQTLEYAAYICSLISEDAQMLFSIRFTGLLNRNLSAGNASTDFFLDLNEFVATKQEVESVTTPIFAREVRSDLEETVFGLLRPLYQSFSGYRLEKEFVEVQISKMRRCGR